MILNLVELLKTDELTSKDRADEFIKNLELIDLFRVKKLDISFKGIKLLNLEFAERFMKYVLTIDEQDTDDLINLKLLDLDELHRELIIEAIRNIRSKQEVEHTGLKSIEKEHEGKYLNMYKAHYENKDGHKKVYEIVSRNKNLNTDNFGKNDRLKSDAVGMVILNSDKDKILLLKEFRMACGEWVYNFPGGLIDNGETHIEAARRELREETGLKLDYIIDVLPPAYTAVGLSNESVTTVIGVASGEFSKSTSVDEEIIPDWFSKTDVLEIIDNKEAMSLRTQSLLYLWAKGGI